MEMCLIGNTGLSFKTISLILEPPRAGTAPLKGGSLLPGKNNSALCESHFKETVPARRG